MWQWYRGPGSYVQRSVRDSMCAVKWLWSWLTEISYGKIRRTESVLLPQCLIDCFNAPVTLPVTQREITVEVCPATHCNTLQHTATHCNTLQHTATHCNTLQHTAMWHDYKGLLMTQCESLLLTSVSGWVRHCEWMGSTLWVDGFDTHWILSSFSCG